MFAHAVFRLYAAFGGNRTQPVVLHTASPSGPTPLKRCVIALVLAACAPAPARLTNGDASFAPAAPLTVSQAFSGSVFGTAGWRILWGGGGDVSGRILLSAEGEARAEDGRLLQGGVRIGQSDDPDAVATCLTKGLDTGQPIPARSFGGPTFGGVDTADAGMSQMLHTRSYRAVARGTCFAVERWTYASPRDVPDGAVRQADLERALDATLASVRID